MLVDIGELEFASGSQRLADQRQARAFPFAGGACAGEHRRPVERLRPLRRQDGGDLGQRPARRLRQARVGAALDPARAERQRLDLLEAEHQGRQGEARLEHIAESRLALDPRPLRLQRLDVAVERAQRHPEFLRQRLPGDRAAAEAKALHEFEQPLGARHCLNLAASGRFHASLDREQAFLAERQRLAVEPRHTRPG